MGREGSEVLNPLFAQFGPDTTKVNTGDKLAVSLNGGSASITFRGKTVTADSSQNAFIQNVIRKELTTAPTAPPIPKAKITFTGHTGVPMESIYSSYEVQHKALHP